MGTQREGLLLPACVGQVVAVFTARLAWNRCPVLFCCRIYELKSPTLPGTADDACKMTEATIRLLYARLSKGLFY